MSLSATAKTGVSPSLAASLLVSIGEFLGYLRFLLPIKGSYSSLSEALVVSAFDTMEQLAQTKRLANCRISGGEY